MRILITIAPLDKKITIPMHYNYIIQSMILNWIDDERYSAFMHDMGYTYEKRNYKLYCFSKLFGRYQYHKETKLITFDHKVQFYISSVMSEFIQYILKTNLISAQEIKLWNQTVRIESLEVVEEPKFKEECNVYTLSPITVYSTFENQFGKKTYYYQPTESDFSNLLKQNLIKKYIAYYR